ncbi:MAG: aminotransferase class V-fold PLP-dependent enzyme [Candidatus Acidiferrum sp.]
MTQTKDALQLAAERGIRYADAVHDRHLAPTNDATAALGRLHEKFPDVPTDPKQVIELLDEIGSPATVAMTGGRYFGFVIGGVLPAALGANWLAGAWGQNACLRVMSPIAAELEEIVLGWICEALRLPADCAGGLVTCATAANFSSLAAARSALLAREGWNVEEDGLFGAPPIDVIVGDEYHASMHKALSMVGLGKNRVTRVPTDAQGRMRADKLPNKISARTIVCIQAGNVNTGAFDPAEEVCKRAKEAGAWVHVDGAFGLWARVSPKYDALTRGLDLADSWATDAHKWPNVGYDCGVVLVRDRMALMRSMGMSAAYLQAGALREPMHHVPESSRRARGVELWAALKSLGKSGFRDLIERTCGFANLFAERLRTAGYEILNDVVINQVLVSFGTAEKTQEVIRRVQQEGTCWCGGTVWQGETAMRISVSNWSTTRDDVEKSAEAIVRVANGIRG